MDEYLEIDGEIVSKADLRIRKACDTVAAIQESPFAELIECRRSEKESETIIFDVEIERGQRTVYDIHRVERIAVELYPLDSIMPEVLALRSDFPHVPHLNLRKNEFPRSLCLFDERYSELKPRWTAPVFVEHIREWLALTARGTLHGDDQPLEPLLLGIEGCLVVPPNLLVGETETSFLSITGIPVSDDQRITLIAEPSVPDGKQKGLQYIATVIECEPQAHGVIRRIPYTLAELHEFLSFGGVDLLEILRHRFRTWKEDFVEKNILDARLVLIFVLPKTREKEGTVETTEIRAFLTARTIRDIGLEIGVWDVSDGTIGLLIQRDQTKRGDDIEVLILNPVEDFSRQQAAALCKLEEAKALKIVAIGVGALGSQIFLNLIRMGYGEWVLVDEDYLLPHNLARHALTQPFIGLSKAQTLAYVANRMWTGGPEITGIMTDVLRPREQVSEALEQAFENGSIILDMSTSIAVARALTHNVTSSARRISIFLNPMATDLVLLAERADRRIKLDQVEMQYYRALVRKELLNDHLRHDGGRVRYAQSCRDVSSTIPQDLVAIHAGIASRSLRQTASDGDATILIWCVDPVELGVVKYKIPVADAYCHEVGGWTLCTDQALIDTVYEARGGKLPNETGGVLVGAYDMERKIVFVVDTILSPPDSQEWPTCYIRGHHGLKRELDRVSTVTGHQLQYIGEWHSHPRGSGCRPSTDDQVAFGWLSEIMQKDGLPPLMLIVGEDYAFYLAHM